MKNRVIIAALAFGALAGCTKESSSVASSGDSAVKFTSTGIATRTTEILDGDDYVDAWESGDEIGITTSGMDDTEYLNKQYIATTTESSISTSFDPNGSDNTIFYPNGQSSDITFYAYYPYSAAYDTDNGYVTIDVSEQDGDLGSVDFMTANYTWTSSNGSEKEIDFNFEHKLSKVVFNLSFNDDIQEYVKESGNSLSATIDNVVGSKAYDIKTGEEYDDGVDDELSSFTLNSTFNEDETSGATVTAILHPSYVEVNMLVTLNETVFLVSIARTLESGNVYTYKVNMGRAAVIVGESTIEAWDSGSPTDSSLEAGSDEYLPQLLWDGSVATTFNGVAFDSNSVKEYEITDGSELALLSELVAAGYTMYGITFTMTGNFTLSDRVWTPITNSNINNCFSGTFDGGGYTISGLNINYNNVYAGLFAVIKSTATVKNLTVKGSVFSTYRNVGAIVGYNNGGRVENCYNEAKIYTANTSNCYYIGGVVGYNYCGTVVNCSNRGSVSGYESVGGVVGYNSGSYTTSATVSNCYNSGAVSGSNMYIGGVVGRNYNATVESCYNSGGVSGVSQAHTIGGIVGYNQGYKVVNCYNIGDVSGYNYTGGVVGDNQSGASVTAVYNTATVTRTYNSGYSGGVAGSNYGSISYGFTVTGDVVGGSSGTTSNSSYFDDQTEVTGDSDEVKSLIEWLNMGTNDGAWEDDVNNVNDGYPILTSINY